MRTILLSTAIGLLLASQSLAAECCDAAACCDQAHGCCHRCGAGKVCKVVCEMKKVKKTVWAVECEEFCAPLPGCGGCKTGCCEDSCCEDSCCVDHCASLRRPMVPPKCGPVRCRKKLVKKEITCEIPVYKCVVVCCNGCCDAGCGEYAPVEDGSQEEAKPAPVLAPAPPTAEAAPMPPIMGASLRRPLKSRS